MKMILIIIGVIIALVFIIPIFTKKEYDIVRDVTINKPSQQVFDYIKHLKNQDNYSKWVMMDPNAKKGYTGTDGTVGSKMSWDSQNKNVGAGEQEITKLTDGKQMDLAIHFIRPFEGRATAYMSTEAKNANETKVSWAFHSKMAYPMNIMLLFMNMDKMVGDDIATGLSNLKTVMEKQ